MRNPCKNRLSKSNLDKVFIKNGAKNTPTTNDNGIILLKNVLKFLCKKFL